MHDAPSAASILAMVKLSAKVNALDRCRILAEAKFLYESKHPETKRGAWGLISKGQRRPGPPAFVVLAAHLTGRSQREIRRAIAIWSRLTVAARVRLTGHKLSGNQSFLYSLAKLNPERQAAALDGVLALRGEKDTEPRSLKTPDNWKGQLEYSVSDYLRAVSDNDLIAELRARFFNSVGDNHV